MTILADARPVIYAEILTDMGDEKAKLIAGLIGNEFFIDFAKQHKERSWQLAVELDPLTIQSAADYHETMCHLRRVSSMWDELWNYALTAKSALLEDAANSPNNQQKEA